MNMSEIANSAKVTLIWRGVLTLLSVLLAAGVGTILSYVSSGNAKQDQTLEKINQTQSDVAQIKWELPVIKENAAKDKAEVIRQITAMEERIQAIRSLGDNDRRELNELKLHVALLKQKLQLP